MSSFPNLPSQQILFTRQVHEAKKAGKHYDIRFVVGDRAYSFATKKDIPTSGNSILLHEQPVHDATYALSKRVEIPDGQYGAGTTVLDFVHKARVGENSTPKKMTFHANGNRYLLVKLNESGAKHYGDKAWLFKNLGEGSLDKTAGVGTAALAHLAQNALTSARLKSRGFGKVVGDSFRQGIAGVTDTSLKARVAGAARGMFTPDLAVIRKKTWDLGKTLGPTLQGATKRQMVGVRQLTEGRFDALKRFGLDKDPVVRAGHQAIKQKFPHVPDLDNVAGKGQELSKLFKDKSHPLLSNVSANLTRGTSPVGKQFKKTELTHRAPAVGALASFVDPVTGAVNSAKALLGSSLPKKNKFLGKIEGMLSKQFVKNPFKHGVEEAGAFKDGLKHKLYHYAVNPISANIKRTSAAVANVLKREGQ